MAAKIQSHTCQKHAFTAGWDEVTRSSGKCGNCLLKSFGMVGSFGGWGSMQQVLKEIFYQKSAVRAFNLRGNRPSCCRHTDLCSEYWQKIGGKSTFCHVFLPWLVSFVVSFIM